MDHERAPGASVGAGSEPDLDVLVRQIVDVHHRYVREMTPVIVGWLDTLVGRHRDRHPELVAARAAFGDLSDALLSHLIREENLLFPFISDLAVAVRSGTRPPRGPFGTLMHPIRVMESDHQAVTTLFDHLNALTQAYLIPADACEIYRLCYAELAAFEDSVRQHMRLENDTVFPRAVALETRLG